jgi:small GTP-binding protein
MDILLSKEREELLKNTRAVLADLRETLGAIGASEGERSALADSILQLDKLFLLVVAGEFNSGKSAFINALVGQNLQAEGVTPTTDKIHVLQYGERIESRPGPQGTWLQSAPIPLLRNTHIVDTPGTNAILREHEVLTTEFIPCSDLVIFITSADRPFTESERAFLEMIRSWGKKIVLVVNKIDILTEDEIEKVLEFVKSAANKLMAEVPAIFPVSSKIAHEAKAHQQNPAKAHGFEPLEAFIHKTLDDTGRFRLKLLNPLGVGHKLVRRQLEICKTDLVSLADDVAVLDNIQKQMVVYNEDMQQNFKARLGEIDRLLYEMERRGNEYFNDTIRIGRITDLISRRKVQAGFKSNVVADTPKKLDVRVSELIDWLVEQELRQWSSVADHLERHQQRNDSRIIGQTGPRESTLSYDRQRLIDSIGLATRQAVSAYDKERESAWVAESVREAVIQTGLVGLGGAGLGAALVVLVHTAWADMTGIVTGVVFMTFGLFILPARRRKAKKQLSAKLYELRNKLMDGLNEQFDRELRRTIRRMEDVVAPYSRFVRTEQSNILTRRDKFNELGNRISGLQDQSKALK